MYNVGLKLIAKIAQPLQSVFNVKKSSLILHRKTPDANHSQRIKLWPH